MRSSETIEMEPTDLIATPLSCLPLWSGPISLGINAGWIFKQPTLFFSYCTLFRSARHDLHSSSEVTIAIFNPIPNLNTKEKYVSEQCRGSPSSAVDCQSACVSLALISDVFGAAGSGNTLIWRAKSCFGFFFCSDAQNGGQEKKNTDGDGDRRRRIILT